MHEVPLRGALDEPGIDEARVRAVPAEARTGSAAACLVHRRDVPGYIDHLESLGAVFEESMFQRLQRSAEAGRAMHPRNTAKLVEYGFVAYRRAKGWPALSRPLGDDDFECGADAPGTPKP